MNILAFKAVFFALVALRLWKMAAGESYNVAMWGYTFPLAALAGAFARAATNTHQPLYLWIETVALCCATLAVALCIIWTVKGWIVAALATARPAPTANRTP